MIKVVVAEGREPVKSFVFNEKRHYSDPSKGWVYKNNNGIYDGLVGEK